MHKLLPHEARAALQRAAMTPICQADPLSRVKAIEDCVAKLKREYPSYFQGECDAVDDSGE